MTANEVKLSIQETLVKETLWDGSERSEAVNPRNLVKETLWDGNVQH
jgi:hypothetical protein